MKTQVASTHEGISLTLAACSARVTMLITGKPWVAEAEVRNLFRGKNGK
jgi:hypothetical protein